MTITGQILIDNGFNLFDNLYTITTVAEQVVSFDAVFHIIYNDAAYPMVTTVEEANATFERLEIDLTLV